MLSGQRPLGAAEGGFVFVFVFVFIFSIVFVRLLG